MLHIIFGMYTVEAGYNMNIQNVINKLQNDTTTKQTRHHSVANDNRHKENQELYNVINDLEYNEDISL